MRASGGSDRKMSPVLEQARPPRRSLELFRRQAPALTFREVGYGYRPGRSLGLSILAHQLALLAIVFFGRYVVLQPAIMVKPQFELTRSSDILVLPTLGGGSEGSGRTGGGKGSVDTASSGLRSRSQRGFAYPGPQPLVSNPPRATLDIQTILQPSLDNLPRLRRYVPLPNIVRPPSATASDLGHAKAALVVKSEKLSLPQPAETPIAAPKLTLPLMANSKTANLVESKPQLPQRAVPTPVEASEVPGARKDQDGLLVLNAVPPPPDVSGKIPRLEARALFAVSPAEATVIAAPGAGTKAGSLPSMEAGSGSPSDNPTGDTLAEIAAGGGRTNQERTGSGAGSGGRYGSGQGSGVNSDGNASGPARGVKSSPGLGTGSATGRGSGTGAGSAPGGGGLPDLGVFQNEKVYTVYLDMRANDEDPTPSWTLQYSVLQPATRDSGASARRIQGTPTPPYAMLKEVPEFAPEQVRKCRHQLLVASAIMDVSGKLEQVSVRQSPESQLVGPLVEALKHWIFEPAQIDGRPVPLKILLGIRLAAPR